MDQPRPTIAGDFQRHGAGGRPGLGLGIGEGHDCMPAASGEHVPTAIVQLLPVVLRLPPRHRGQ